MGEFRDGLEHLPLAERVTLRAQNVAELAAQVTGMGGVVSKDQLQAVCEEYQSFREDIAAALGVSADPENCDLVESVKALVWQGQRMRTTGDRMAAALVDRQREVERLRREVEFEANAEQRSAAIVGREGHEYVNGGCVCACGQSCLTPGAWERHLRATRDAEGTPLCACATPQQAAALHAAGFSRPVCSVHPDGES